MSGLIPEPTVTAGHRSDQGILNQRVLYPDPQWWHSGTDLRFVWRIRLRYTPTMPQSTLAGLTQKLVLRTLADLDAGIDHPFGQPTGYELVYQGKRYAPKAVVGLACRYSIGRTLQPDEFSGGEAPVRPDDRPSGKERSRERNHLSAGKLGQK